MRPNRELQQGIGSRIDDALAWQPQPFQLKVSVSVRYEHVRRSI